MPTAAVPALKPSPGEFRRLLLSWHARSGRHDLPWRGDFSPYRVLVSEFMLQQTTVSTVLPYFHRFMSAFPALKDLAAAPPERVMELWSGLGYYARARNLHAAARMLVDRHGGALPETRDAVEELPGVGRYTAGALLSFIHDKPEALVDGNVIRVLARVYGIDEDVKAPAVQEKIWALAWKLVPPRGARRFNSALMDLGATVCRPSGPDCLVCPFFKACSARRQGRQDDIPLAGADRPKKEMHRHVGLVRDGGRWALVRRPEKGLYAGMWEFPAVETLPGAGAGEVAGALSQVVGAPVRLDRRLAGFTQVLTHRKMHLHPWLGEADSRAGAKGWFSPAEIGGMAIASYTRRLLAMLPR
jgi:A/G-specific adenine glycosylase